MTTGRIPSVDGGIQPTIIDAAGDLIYGASNDTPARLAIGTAGQVLTVNSGATAPEWAAVPAAGMTFLSSATLSGTATSISNISQNYNHLFVTIENMTCAVNGVLFICNPKSAASNVTFRLYESYVNGTTVTTRNQNTTVQFANDVSSSSRVDAFFWFYNYSEASRIRHFSMNSRTASTSTGAGAHWSVGTSTSTGAIDQIEITANGSTIAGGTLRIYGVK